MARHPLPDIKEELLQLKSYALSEQCGRDLLCLLCGILATAGYAVLIWQYLQESPNPHLLYMGFGLSLLVTFYYEYERNDWRGTLVQMSTMSVVFMAAAYFAPHVRHMYFDIVSDFSKEPLAAQWLGQDFFKLVSNRLVGFGSCFAASAFLVRITCRNRILKKLNKLTLRHINGPRCPHCQETLPL